MRNWFWTCVLIPFRRRCRFGSSTLLFWFINHRKNYGIAQISVYLIRMFYGSSPVLVTLSLSQFVSPLYFNEITHRYSVAVKLIPFLLTLFWCFFWCILSLSCIARGIWSGGWVDFPALLKSLFTALCSCFLECTVDNSCMLTRLLSLEKQMSSFWMYQPWRSTLVFMWCCTEVEKCCSPKCPLH